MKPPMPQLLSLAPRGVIVDQEGAYRGLAPWFDAALLREILRRYNEYRPLADFAEAWAALEADSTATAHDARREAALALAKARSLASLVDEAEESPRRRREAARRRLADRLARKEPPAGPGAEPSEPN